MVVPDFTYTCSTVIFASFRRHHPLVDADGTGENADPNDP